MKTVSKKDRKVIKRWAAKFLERNSKQLEPQIDGLLIHRSEGDYDSEKHKFLVEATTKENALNMLERYYPVWGIELTPSAYDCTGRAFCNPANVRMIAPGRFLVNLSISYDV